MNVPLPDHRFGVALGYLPIEPVSAVAEVLQPQAAGGVFFDLTGGRFQPAFEIYNGHLHVCKIRNGVPFAS